MVIAVVQNRNDLNCAQKASGIENNNFELQQLGLVTDTEIFQGPAFIA